MCRKCHLKNTNEIWKCTDSGVWLDFSYIRREIIKVKKYIQIKNKKTVFQKMAYCVLLSMSSFSPSFRGTWHAWAFITVQFCNSSITIPYFFQKSVSQQVNKLIQISVAKTSYLYFFYTDNIQVRICTPSKNCFNNLYTGRCTYDSQYGKRVSYHLFHIYNSLVYIKGNSKLQGHYACNWGFYKVQ